MHAPITNIAILEQVDGTRKRLETMANRKVSHFFYIHRVPLRLHMLNLDENHGQAQLLSDPSFFGIPQKQPEWHGHTNWTEGANTFFVDCHYAGEDGLFLRRIEFWHHPFWLRYNLEVFVGNHTSIVTNGRHHTRMAANWCIIVRYIMPPSPRSIPPLRPAPVAKL